MRNHSGGRKATRIYNFLSHIIEIHVRNYKVWSLSGSRHPVMATAGVKEEIKEEIIYALK